MLEKFKKDVENVIDDTKHVFIDVEEIGDDVSGYYNFFCLSSFLKILCCFVE